MSIDMKQIIIKQCINKWSYLLVPSIHSWQLWDGRFFGQTLFHCSLYFPSGKVVSAKWTTRGGCVQKTCSALKSVRQDLQCTSPQNTQR